MPALVGDHERMNQTGIIMFVRGPETADPGLWIEDSHGVPMFGSGRLVEEGLCGHESRGSGADDADCFGGHSQEESKGPAEGGWRKRV